MQRTVSQCLPEGLGGCCGAEPPIALPIATSAFSCIARCSLASSQRAFSLQKANSNSSRFQTSSCGKYLAIRMNLWRYPSLSIFTSLRLSINLRPSRCGPQSGWTAAASDPSGTGRRQSAAPCHRQQSSPLPGSAVR